MDIEKIPYDKKVYEVETFSKNIWKDDIKIAYEVVENFIKEKKRVLFGGMAIDMSLRLKGKKLYSDEALPDYDFLTPTNAEDAYEIGFRLYKKGLKNVDVINAIHIYTMKVRVNFTTVADVGYLPADFYEKIPVLEYKGFRFVHPHYQYIDQHIALCNPFVRAPDETVFRRWDKDMIRHDMLYEEYPIEISTDTDDVSTDKYNKFEIDFKVSGVINDLFIHNSCITGYAALLILNQISAEKLGKPILEFEHANEISQEKIIYYVPEGVRFAVYKDDLRKNLDDTDKKYKILEYRDSMVERLPPRAIVEFKTSETGKNQIEMYDNMGFKVSGHLYIPEHNIYIANPQDLLRYFLVYHIYYDIIGDKKLSEFHKKCYYMTRKLTTAMITDVRFSPSISTYGSHVYSETYYDNREQILMSVKKKTEKVIKKPTSIKFDKLKPDPETPFKGPGFDYENFRIGFKIAKPDYQYYEILNL